MDKISNGFVVSSNQDESLSGIETHVSPHSPAPSLVLIKMNPYQGLKRDFIKGASQGYPVLIKMNPYQGLKRVLQDSAG